MVDEPSVEDTIAILRGLKERYEVHMACASRTARSSPRRRFRTATSATAFSPTKPSISSTKPRRE
jgi:ATP-dependent Clp protease ATP-binding subunit ClpB